MEIGKTITRKKIMMMVILIVVFCELLFFSQKFNAEDLQKKDTILISTSSVKFSKDVLNEAFNDNITHGYHTYILIRILPTFYPESQIMIGLKAGEQHGQASYMCANISMHDAFISAKKRNDSPKTVAGLMKIQQKDIIIPRDVVLKWMSGYWDSLETAVRKMGDSDTNRITMDGTTYIIEVYTLQNKTTLEIIGPNLTEKYDHLNIASILDWMSPIIEYVKKARPENDKQ